MGLGDEIMGSGFARGARRRGKRIAFGDGRTISWHKNADIIYRNNPNVAPPGDEMARDLEWIDYRVGHRQYGVMHHGRWAWNADFRAPKGELYFDQAEIEWADQQSEFDVLIEPSVKKTAPNKQWPLWHYQVVATELANRGLRVVQVDHGVNQLLGIRYQSAPDFRHLCAALWRRGRLYLGPEGGLHHAAAALDIPAVVIFGGYISPQVTGYEGHRNLFAADGLGCGNVYVCAHCRRAMLSISPGQVLTEALQILCANRSDEHAARLV